MDFDFTDYVNGTVSRFQLLEYFGYPKRYSINKMFKELGLYDDYVRARAKRRVNSTKTTFQNKYGVDNVFQANWCKEKMKQTCLHRYGVEHVSQSNNFQSKIDHYKSSNLAKTSLINAVEIYAKENHLVRLSKLIENYGQGWFKYYSPDIIMYNHRKLVDEKYAILAKDYFNFKKANKSRSYCEKEIVDFIQTFYDGDIITNKRNIIKPYELDIYLPRLKIAIEENDRFWHTKENPFSRVNNYDEYHKIKQSKCQESGILLIMIDRNDWLNYKNDICNMIEQTIKRKLKDL